MSGLPVGWIWTRLEDLAAAEGGSITDGPFGSELKSEHYTPGGPRVIRLQNIGDGAFRDEDKAHISEDRFRRLSKHVAMEGDVLVAALGDVLPRACVVPAGIGPAIVKADCFRIRLQPGVNPRFVAALLNSPPLRYQAQKLVSGVGRPRLNLSKVRGLELPVPPAGEQNRIVGAIEKEFSRIERGEGALRRIGLQSRRLELSLLANAFSGRLVSTPLDSGALLDLGLPQSSSRGASSASVARLPDGWVQARLDTVAEVKLGRQRSPKNHHGPHMRPYLRAANVTWRGLDLSDVKQMNFSPEELEIFRLRPGDILLGEASGSASEVGKPAIWGDEIANCCFQNTLLRVRTTEVDPRYLLWYFKWLARSEAFAKRSRGVGIHHLGAAALSSWMVPLPPRGHQTVIVAALEAEMSRIVAAYASVRKNANKAARQLRASILTAAFAGELGGPDAATRPASALAPPIVSDSETETHPKTRTSAVGIG